MAKKNNAGGAYASLAVTVFKSAGEKETMKQSVERFESEQLVMEDIYSDYPLKTAEVVQSVSTKVSDSVYWGEGTWDKIPFSVEVFSSVKLKCSQSAEKIGIAQRLAHDMAVAGAREHIANALGSHVQNIKETLFSGYFND